MVANSNSNNSILHALRSNAQPVSIYDLNFGEESAFPWLFPTGTNGFCQNRKIKLGPSMHFRTRLYNYQGPLVERYHVPIACCSFIWYQFAKEWIGICLKKTSIHREVCNDEPLTASFICSHERDPHVMHNSYMFMKNIRGTIAYFKIALNNLLATVRTLGPPTLFVTVSAAD